MKKGLPDQPRKAKGITAPQHVVMVPIVSIVLPNLFTSHRSSITLEIKTERQ